MRSQGFRIQAKEYGAGTKTFLFYAEVCGAEFMRDSPLSLPPRHFRRAQLATVGR